MKDTSENIDTILPFGEMIRGLANQPELSKSDLNRFLKSRGVFSKRSDKSDLVPLLTTLLLSPIEFDDLRECLNTKEDNQKKSTSRIKVSVDLRLPKEIRDINLLESFDPNEQNYKVKGQPSINVKKDSKSKATIGFEIIRHDLNKSWYNSQNIFQGQLDLEISPDNQLIFTKSYTSKETSSIASLIQKNIIKNWKGKKLISESEELTRVLFRDFTNEERIVFFYRLSSDSKSSDFEFSDIIQIQFSPSEENPLPDGIDFMEKKTQLGFKGVEIQQTFFFKEKKYHKYLEVWEIQSAFKFDYSGYKGTCQVTFSFNDYLSKKGEAEFEINISAFSLNNASDYTTQEKTRLKRNLLNIFNQEKEIIYTQFINRDK